MSNIDLISKQLNIDHQKIISTIELLDNENTVPFIARYRKEVTGGLDEEQIRSIRDLIEKLRTLDERRETILKTIDEQGKLSSELKKKIQSARTKTELEDLYQPYKPKRKTRASTARENGLQPLADLILEQVHISQSFDELAKPYLNDSIPTFEEALAGARDIVAETISDHTEVRRTTRIKAAQWGQEKSEKIKKAEDPKGIYQNYYEFEYRVDRMRPHQILAINRGEKEKILRVKINVPERDWRFAVNSNFPPDRKSPLSDQLEISAEDAAERLLLPAIERDIRRSLTEKAETHAIQVFATNLHNLLNQPPLANHVVMGIDPGYRTGCKVAVIDQTGKPLDTVTIYPHPPQNLTKKAIEIIHSLTKKHAVTLIAIGNGTASRETEQLIADLIQNFELNIHYLIVSEAGASVYSASKLARTELPNMDVSMRGAVSIARRVQDPLAELVKIDPKSIGVGMYQHDVDQKQLTQSLDSVVESVVNNTGVDVNSASVSLLTYVSGIGPSLASRIVDHRNKEGSFKNREALKTIKGFGPKSYQQAAGFLRIRDGDNPLDISAIHPESYRIANEVLQRAGLELDSTNHVSESVLNEFRSKVNIEELATELNTGIPTLEDIFEQLIQPGRDPREDLPAPILRSDVLKMEDLVTGMRLKGTVRNVVDFGSFIDIGVKQDGLLHRSQYPFGVNIAVGDVITVEILKVEIDRGRISLGWSKSD